MRLEGLSHRAGLLLSKVDGLVLLALVQLSKILLCLLVHDNVASGDRFADDATERK